MWYHIVNQRGIDQACCTFIKGIQSQWHLDDVKIVFYDDIFLRLRNINMWFYFPIAQECGILKPLSKWCKLKIRVGQPVLCPAKYYISLNFESLKSYVECLKRLLFIMMYLHINGTKYVPQSISCRWSCQRSTTLFFFMWVENYASEFYVSYDPVCHHL